MRKYLLPEVSDAMHYYRANLHCHTTISDGRKTPEQTKADYVAHGYQVVAFTDHNVFLQHNDLCDDTFLALNGYEIDINDSADVEFRFKRTCHLCLIAKTQEMTEQVCYHREKYLWGNMLDHRDDIHFDHSLPDYERVYTHEGINDVIQKGRDAGFFVTYNHPAWSLESYPEYSGYRGMNAMEIVNFGCEIEGYRDDNNGATYDDLLRLGNKIWCIATDDNHNIAPDTDPKCDSYGGYVMIGAPKLGYAEIIDALERGQFYSSTGSYRHIGPQILSLYVEDGAVHVRTTDACRIFFQTGIRLARLAVAEEGKCITEATFPINEEMNYFRLVVVDPQGYEAFTNAYFIRDIL